MKKIYQQPQIEVEDMEPSQMICESIPTKPGVFADPDEGMDAKQRNIFDYDIEDDE